MARVRECLGFAPSQQLAPGVPRFIDYAWTTFDARTVLAILASSERSYEAHQPILFAGLWDAYGVSNRLGLVRQGIMLAAIEQVCRAEASGSRCVSKQSAARRHHRPTDEARARFLP